MNRLNIKIFTILLSIFALPLSASAITAEQILDKAAASLTSAPSVSIKFTTSGSMGNSTGSITMSGNKFTFTSGELSVWYNGSLQWALMRSAEEVSLTKPTASELIESNPFAIITNHKKLYTAKLLDSANGNYRIRLTPKGRHGHLRTATITIGSSNYAVKALSATLNDNSSFNVKVTSTTKGKALPVSYFTFDAKAHPSIELIDLR